MTQPRPPQPPKPGPPLESAPSWLKPFLPQPTGKRSDPQR